MINGEHYSKHPYFDLLLPSNSLLESLVGHRIEGRVTCHEWPLSCVEVIDFEGGGLKYCKTMRPPSVEVEVYRSLSSPILVSYQVILQSDYSTSILLDSFDGARLTPKVVLSYGFDAFLRILYEKLGSLVGTKVVYLDLSTQELVRLQMSEMVERLWRLYTTEPERQIESALLEVTSKLARSEVVEQAFIEGARYSNGDLSAENILIKDEEIKIIDWAFPKIISSRVEAVNLCRTLGLDPYQYFTDEIIAASLLLQVSWYVECAEVWFPIHHYRDEVRSLLLQLSKLRVRW